MNVTAITTACWRPEAWARAEYYVSRQTVKPIQWIVADDDDPKTLCTAGQEYHYWPEMRGRGSLSKKIRRIINNNMVRGDAIVFIENDDYYPPDYIEWCIAGLQNHAIFGEGRALYYNVVQRFWFEHTNLQHASLCATSMTREAFPHLAKQVSISECPFLDVRIWNKPPVSWRVADPHLERIRHSVGIKAMPGRTGYGGGHRGRDKSAVDDLGLKKLRSVIGDDAEFYSTFYDPSKRELPPEKNKFIDAAPIAKPRHSDTTTMKLKVKSECGRVHGPNWYQWLARFVGMPGVIGAEIGTFEGDSAQWMLDNVFTDPTSKYHCIDPFTGSIEHRVHNKDVTKLEETTRAKLEVYPNVEIHKGYSEEVLRTWKGKLDVLYVDGDHTARAALRDGVLGFDLLNHGGIMIFDDYQWADMPNELDRPKLGIDAFLKCYTGKMKVLSPRGWQIAIQKTE